MRHSAHASRSLATWPSQMQTQVMSPTSSTRSLLWTVTRCSSTIRTTISPTSRKPRTRTLDKSMFPQCLNPLCRTFLMMILLFKYKAEKSMQSGNRCQTEREKGKRRFCDQCCTVDVKERLTERYSCESEESQQNSFLESLRKFYSDGWDLREHLQRRDRQAGISGTFRSEKMKLDWVPHGYPEFEAKNFRIRIDWVTAGAWISKTTLIGSQSEQAQRERIHSCSELVMKDHLHQESYARSCPEIERMSKDAAMLSRGNYWTNNEDWKNFSHSMIRNHEQWVYSSTILTHRAVLAVPTFRIKLLLPRVQESLSREVGMPRNTRESMSIPGNVFDRQHARRNPDELYDDSRNLAKPSGIADYVEDSEKRSNWE